MPRMDPKNYVERTCKACGVLFMGTPKAARCTDCIKAGRRQMSQTKRIMKEAAVEARSESLRGLPIALGGDPFGDREERTERRRRKSRERCAEIDRMINKKPYLPKGYRKAKEEEMNTPLYHYWKQICLADGAMWSVISRHKDTKVSDEDAATLVKTYVDLRLKGYRSEALITLCPQNLLEVAQKEQLEEAIEEMPEVTEEIEEDAFDPLEGLTPELREEVEAFAATQQQKHEAVRLGFVA